MSCAITVQLILGFDLAYAKSRFSHDAAGIEVLREILLHCFIQ